MSPSVKQRAGARGHTLRLSLPRRNPACDYCTSRDPPNPPAYKTVMPGRDCASTGAELAIAGVTQPGQDVAALVQPDIDGCQVDGHLWVVFLH